MGRLVKQIYLKMMIEPMEGYYLPHIGKRKEDSELLLECLISNNAEGIAGIVFLSSELAMQQRVSR